MALPQGRSVCVGAPLVNLVLLSYSLHQDAAFAADEQLGGGDDRLPV